MDQLTNEGGRERHRRYCCSVDSEGRVVIVWDRSPTQQATEQAAPTGQECVEVEDEAQGRALVEEAPEHWFDRSTRRFERRRDWQPTGLPPVTERVAGEDLRLIPDPGALRLDWPDPPGAIRLRINGEEYLAERPFDLELPARGRYVVEVTDARFRSSVHVIEVREPAGGRRTTT